MTGDAPPSLEDGDEYGPVSLAVSWHLLSLLCFAAVLAAKPLAALVPPELLPSARWGRIYLPALASLILATLGLLFGLVGMRRTGGRGLARLGTALNALALLFGLLLTAAYYSIHP